MWIAEQLLFFLACDDFDHRPRLPEVRNASDVIDVSVSKQNVFRCKSLPVHIVYECVAISAGIYYKSFFGFIVCEIRIGAERAYTAAPGPRSPATGPRHTERRPRQ